MKRRRKRGENPLLIGKRKKARGESHYQSENERKVSFLLRGAASSAENVANKGQPRTTLFWLKDELVGCSQGGERKHGHEAGKSSGREDL